MFFSQYSCVHCWLYSYGVITFCLVFFKNHLKEEFISAIKKAQSLRVVAHRPRNFYRLGWLLSTILLLSLFAGLLYYTRRIKYLPKILHTDFGVNLKEISWPRCKTLKQLFGAVRQVGAPEFCTPLAKTIL